MAAVGPWVGCQWSCRRYLSICHPPEDWHTGICSQNEILSTWNEYLSCLKTCNDWSLCWCSVVPQRQTYWNKWIVFLPLILFSSCLILSTGCPRKTFPLFILLYTKRGNVFLGHLVESVENRRHSNLTLQVRGCFWPFGVRGGADSAPPCFLSLGTLFRVS